MKAFFTHLPRLLLRPPGFNPLSLLPLLLFLLLPAMASAQVNCFSAFNAGANQTWCEGEEAFLDGGYDVYTASTGTPEVTWTMPDGDEGDFYIDGVNVGNTASGVNFNNSENGVTGFPIVSFIPDAGVTEIRLRLLGNTDSQDCLNGTEVEDVTLFFDPIQNTPIDATVTPAGGTSTQVLDDADETTTNTISVPYGGNLMMAIDENFVIDNGQQFDDIRRYVVSYTGTGGVLGLPPAGIYTQPEFDDVFNDLTLTSMVCDDATVTLNINAFYDRDPTNSPAPSGDCAGPVTSVEITLVPRPEPVATIGALGGILIVCEDDTQTSILVTGTPFTTVTYKISYDGGSSYGADQTLQLNANGTNTDLATTEFVIDATNGTAGEDIIIILTEIEFQTGPPCPVTISKPLTIEVVPIPQVSMDLANPDDAVICNANNGGPLSVNYVFSTTTGEGSYSFDLQEFADGSLVFTQPGFTVFLSDPDNDGVATETVTLNFEDPVPDGTVMTYMVVGASVTKNGEQPNCVNDAPNASFSVLIQKESYLVAQINDSEGGTITLSDYSGSGEGDVADAEVTFCDNELFTLDVIDPTTNNAFADIIGSEALFNVDIVDPNGVLTTAVAGTYDFDNPFFVSQLLDIDNSDTDPSSFTITLTPFMDNDGDGIYNDGESTDDCLGNPVSVTVNVRPAPTVTVAVSEDEVCSGESVTVTITASEPGTANLILNQGGSPIPVAVDTDNGDGTWSGTYTSADLTALTMFTVTTFTGDVAGCAATVNQMVMTEVEELPNVTVAADPEANCDLTTFVTFTASGGNGTGFDITYTLNGGPRSQSIPAGSFTTGFQPANDIFRRENTVTILTVSNAGGLACTQEINETITFTIEEIPAVTCASSAEGPICSGDDYSFTFSADSNDPSNATGDVLFYSIVVSTTEYNVLTNAFETTDAPPVIVAATDAAPQISGTAVNMSGYDQTITATATPFYADDENGPPTEIGDNCAGEPTACSVTVRTMPMATFGGNDAICEGGPGVVFFTGPPNGSARLTQVDDEGNLILDFGVYSFDGGGILGLGYNSFTEDFILRISEITDANLCVGDMTFDFAVDVTPRPEAQFDPDTDATICEGTDRVITLTGTPFAAVTIDSDVKDANDQVVNLDENGEGSFTVTGDENETFTITDVTITTEDGNGDDFTCSANEDEIAQLEPFVLTVNPAPDGALMSNAILCAGEAPQVQFNIINGVAGPFTIFVNGVEFNGVMNGDVLDFTGTAFETLEVTTTFTLESIVEEGEGLVCSDLFDGDEPTIDVIVNPIPEATAGETPAVICSGDDLQLSVTGTPAQGAEDNDLMFEVTANNAIGDLAAGESIILDAAAAADLNTALGLSGPFINGSTTDPESVSLTIVPFFEGGAGTGGDGDCEPTEGFTGDFAEGNWTVSSGSQSSVTFTNSTLTLFGAEDDGGLPESETNASASYTFTQDGTVSFDMLIELESGVFGGGGSGGPIFDIFLIDFEGDIVYNSQLEQEVNASFSQVVTPNTTLLLLLDDDEEIFDVDDSQVTVSNFLFEPTCTRCEGEAVNIDFEVLPALFADFDDEDFTVCQGDQPEICLTGTPDATVTVFMGDGVFEDIKLDANGNGCFTPVSGLQPPFIKYTITGITTLGQDPECSLIYGATGPMLTITVIPTPFASVAVDPFEVCAGDELFATITGTPGATVTYTYTLDGTSTTGSVVLGDEGEEDEGEAQVLLPTGNAGPEVLTGTISLSLVTVPNGDGVCSAELEDSADYEVRPLPTGEITAGPPACNGGSVPIFFEPTSALENNYRLRITGPDETRNVNVVATAGTPVFVFDATVPGDYELIRIADGRMNPDAVVCVNEGSFSTTTVIIEEVPNLTANVSGTIGTAALDNLTILNRFRAVTCDMATINVDLGSATTTSNPAGDNNPLWVQVEIISNDGPMLGLPEDGVTVAPYDLLSVNGILENLVAPANANITIVLTPYFENGSDLFALNEEECAGPTLTFDVTVLPAVTLSIDGDSTDEVCEGDPVTINLTGSPGGVVSFTTVNLLGVSANPVTLDGSGNASITATAGPAGSASVTLDMIQVVTVVNGISRTCMEMPDIDFDILVNPNPSATISFDPPGPICNGETADLVVTLGEGELDGSYTFSITGEGDITVDIVDGTAVLIDDRSFTSTQTFELTNIVNNTTGCETSAEEGTLSSATIMVEEIPTGEVIVTIDGEETIVSGGVPAEFEICANERVDVEARNTNGNGFFIESEFDGSEPIWNRPNTGSDASFCTLAGSPFNATPYDVYTFTVDAADMYTFTMSASIAVDPWIALYEGGFDAGMPCVNLLDTDDDGGDVGLNSMLTIELDLVPGDYTLVASQWANSNSDGPYTLGFSSENGGNIVGLSSSGSGVGPLVGEDYVSVDFSISENIDFFGLGQSGTIALPIEDFEAQFSREYNMIFGSQVTVELEVTYYNETDPNGDEKGLDDGECVGITDFITIIINPNPKTEDVMTMTCSGVALDYDLDAAITNGVVGATYTYTVASSDVDVSGLDRTVASDANVTDEFDNFSDGEYTVIYTVTPFGTDGDEDCQGNDFELVVIIKPEPVITADLTAEVCSGDETLCIILLDNETDVQDQPGTIVETDTFEVISITYSLESDEFLIGENNAEVGDKGGFDVIAFDVFTNLSSAPQTVTYVVQGTSEEGCVGEEETIVVTILPEAVVADFMIKVCSGGTIDLGFADLSANGVGNILSFRRYATPLTTIRVFDENRNDVTLGTFAGSSFSNPGITAIQDSFLNQGTATLSVFYDVEIFVTGEETGDEGGPLTCGPYTFTLEVKVVEEVDVVLEPINGQTAICAGEPITLVATYDGSGNEQTFEYSYTSADGVVLQLTPSAAGGEVVVDAVSGMGNATVMVMVTDDNSCVAMATRVVSVGTSPEEMEVAGFEDPCIGEFSFYSITPTSGSTYLWSLSNPAAGTFTNNPSTGSNASITFNDSQGFGPFEVMVTETSAAGCSTTSSLTVNLYSETTADFVAEEDASDPLTFNFTELAGGSVENYLWDFGDGSDMVFEANPSHTYDPADPAAMTSYTVTLMVVGGCSADGQPVSVSKIITLNSDAEDDEIALFQGVNFISFDVMPTDNSASAIFGNLNGVVRVVTVDDGAPSSYEPTRPSFLNSLSTIEPGFGYVVIMNQDATLTVSGSPIDDAYLRPTGTGINYVACIPEGPTPAADAWSTYVDAGTLSSARTFGNNVFDMTGDFTQSFNPTIPVFLNSMTHAFNGLGYMLVQHAAAVPRTSNEGSSENFEFLYGQVSGVDFNPGDVVEILNGAGVTIGTLTTDENGYFKATPIFGRVEVEEGIVDGILEEGEAISFRYRDQVIESDLSFQGNFAGTELNLDFTDNTRTPVVEMTVSVMPNPAYNFTNVVVDLPETATISIQATDVTGRVVKQLLPKQLLTAGVTTVEWNDMTLLPAGMYHLIVTRDGQVLPELTQRVIKR